MKKNYLLICILGFHVAIAQTTNFASGSFIVNMGVVPQTVDNGLRPYGLVYEMLSTYGVPVYWVINPNKAKDGIDFTHEGVSYSGSAFIIPAEFRTTAVNNAITAWRNSGVVGNFTTRPLKINSTWVLKMTSAPRWTLDKQSGDILVEYFNNAGIPPSAYGGGSSNWKNPSALSECDDVFGLAHADPTWANHQKLVEWNSNEKGAIWTGCHSGSALELMFNPANRNQQANFLSNKTGIATGAGPYAFPDNSLIKWTAHTAGTPPYIYSDNNHPIMQFMGIMDQATENGSERIYIPVQAAGAGWRSTTTLAVLDPDHPQSTLPGAQYRAAALVYGPGFGNASNGLVMYQAGHKYTGSTAPPNIAAQRAYFNFSLLASRTKAPEPIFDTKIKDIKAGDSENYTFTISGGRDISEFTVQWSSSCGGLFSTPNSVNTLYTAPIVNQETTCLITMTLTDACNRVYKTSQAIKIKCATEVATTIVNPCAGTPSGAITLNITGATGPFSWTYTTKNPNGGPFNGTGTILNNLIAADYDITVTPAVGCPENVKVKLNNSPAVGINGVVANVICSSPNSGSITINTTSGKAPFNFNWADLAGNSNPASRTGLNPGTYQLTTTDANGCTNVSSFEVDGYLPFTATPTITPVSCFGFANGSISFSVTNAISPVSYLWSDGGAGANRTNLTPGTYSVTITDGNNCPQVISGLIITQPAALLSTTFTKEDVKIFGATSGPNSGSIDVTPAGGTAPYTYNWTGPGGPYTTQDLVDLGAGTYNLLMTDARGCQSTLSVVITQPAPFSITGSTTQPTCPPDADQNGADGAITLTVNGGVSPYSYSWVASNGGIVPAGQEVLQNLTNLVAGVYTVTITDDNGATGSVSYTLVFQNPNPAKPSGITN